MARGRFLISCGFALVLIGAGQAAPIGWFGTWKLRLQDPTERPETLIYSDAGKGAMRMISVEDQRELITHFDGKPSFDRGAKAPHSSYLAVKGLSPKSYTWTFVRPGKSDVKGRNTLADDGKSFTEVSWLATKPEQKVTLIYDKVR